jgi:hypothetical protein
MRKNLKNFLIKYNAPSRYCINHYPKNQGNGQNGAKTSVFSMIYIVNKMIIFADSQRVILIKTRNDH